MDIVYGELKEFPEISAQKLFFLILIIYFQMLFISSGGERVCQLFNTGGFQ